MSLTNLLHELHEFDITLVANNIGYIDPTPPHEYYDLLAGNATVATSATGLSTSKAANYWRNMG